MAVNVQAHMPIGYEGTEGGRFDVQVQTGGKVDLWFDGDYDHNGVRIEGPRGMANKVYESRRGWGEGIPESAANMARTAYASWLEQFGASPVETVEEK